MFTPKQMRTELRNLNCIAVAVGVAGLVLAMGSGCAMQDKFTSARDNSAFQNLIQDQYSKSHAVARPQHLVALTGAQEPAAETLQAAQEESRSYRAQSPDQTYQASQIPSSGSGGGFRSSSR